MVYDIYYHNDFDGRASAAIIADFFLKRGDKVKHFIPINYGDQKTWGLHTLPRPSAVVDFQYNPYAVFWFDHHPTAFYRNKWRRSFRTSIYKRWDASYKSACHLVLDSLTRDFNYRPPKHLEDLARWLDVVDGAGYRSAKQTIEKKEFALKIDDLVEQNKSDPRFQTPLIQLLRKQPLARIIKVPTIARMLVKLKRERTKILEYYKKNLCYERGVAYIDLTTQGRRELRFAPYYFYPHARYSIGIKRNAEGHAFHISVGANPWKENSQHIGNYLRNKYKGGGHKNAGGAEIFSKKDIPLFLKDIIHHFGTSR